MKANLHHAAHWMHDETAAAGHWCNVHMLHDYHFWLYLLMAVAVIALIAFLLSTGQGIPVDHELRYYSYPYFGA
jgi:hypothetical protein